MTGNDIERLSESHSITAKWINQPACRIVTFKCVNNNKGIMILEFMHGFDSMDNNASYSPIGKEFIPYEERIAGFFRKERGFQDCFVIYDIITTLDILLHKCDRPAVRRELKKRLLNEVIFDTPEGVEASTKYLNAKIPD